MISKNVEKEGLISFIVLLNSIIQSIHYISTVELLCSFTLLEGVIQVQYFINVEPTTQPI